MLHRYMGLLRTDSLIIPTYMQKFKLHLELIHPAGKQEENDSGVQKRTTELAKRFENGWKRWK